MFEHKTRTTFYEEAYLLCIHTLAFKGKNSKSLNLFLLSLFVSIKEVWKL